ncbi:MAG: hypothetical protein A3E78_13805 [Alphaproteobacteria bacterium RIFCSPHIGHO2_12_FULL_63_12]|nr:MAG: hypothetical protein A3E78_13805 [Alphaproteobacteria bacterium RIFCSPHIGHO2_12_FULL_63_12]
MKIKALAMAGAVLAVVALIAGIGMRTPVIGQSVFVTESDVAFTDNIDAANESVAIALKGAGAVSVEISGTFVGTMKPQVSYDGGSDYIDVQFYDPAKREYVDTITAAARYFIANAAGASHARVLNVAYTSGTAVCIMRRTSAPNFIDPIRPVNVVKAISDTSGGGTADITSWTPASGKKIRIMGVSVMSTADATITLRYGTTPTDLAIWPLQTGISERDLHLDFGPKGFLIDTADATAYIVKGAATIIGGSIWGREEDPTP